MRTRQFAFARVELALELINVAGFFKFLVVPRIENLQEDPLRPAIVTLVGRADTAPLVVSETQTSKLSAHVCNIRLGIDPRMNARHDCVLLGRQTE